MSKQNSYAPGEIKRIIARYRAGNLSLNKFAQKEKIPRTNLQRWIKNENPPPTARKKRKPEHPDIEDKLHAWVLEQGSKGLIVTNLDLHSKALEIATREKVVNFKASDGWITKFKKRKRLTYRVPAHVSRKTKLLM